MCNKFPILNISTSHLSSRLPAGAISGLKMQSALKWAHTSVWGKETAWAPGTDADAESLELRLGASNAVAWRSYLCNLIEAIITFISQNSAPVQLNHLCISESSTHVFLSNFLHHLLSFFYAVAKAMNVCYLDNNLDKYCIIYMTVVEVMRLSLRFMWEMKRLMLIIQLHLFFFDIE